jgi:hypothetical protein
MTRNATINPEWARLGPSANIRWVSLGAPSYRSVCVGPAPIRLRRPKTIFWLVGSAVLAGAGIVAACGLLALVLGF